jgi:D-glycero-D-manno-heptose 1,7-bisphosphate phosphatase
VSRPAVFLDRDGTVIRHVDLLAAPEQVELLPGAASAIRRLKASGRATVVVTNQPVIARGLATAEQIARVNEQMVHLLALEGATLDGIYVCPHHPAFNAACDCRKPAPGLLLRAADELGLDLASSVMIGDRASDIEAGRRAGCTTIRVKSDAPPVSLPPVMAAVPLADHLAEDLAHAAELVVTMK